MRGSLLRRLALGCGLWTILLAPVLGQGELADLRSDVRTSPPPAPRAAAPAARNDGDCDDHCDNFDDDCWSGDFWLLAGYVVGITVTAPFWGPPSLIGDTYTEAGYFAHHPYLYDVGYMLIGPGEAAGLAGPREPWP